MQRTGVWTGPDWFSPGTGVLSRHWSPVVWWGWQGSLPTYWIWISCLINIPVLSPLFWLCLPRKKHTWTTEASTFYRPLSIIREFIGMRKTQAVLKQGVFSFSYKLTTWNKLCLPLDKWEDFICQEVGRVGEEIPIHIYIWRPSNSR